MGEKTSREQAQLTFRQFAWNLAGTLADKTKASARPQRQAGAKR